MAYDFSEADANRLIDKVEIEEAVTKAYDSTVRGHPWFHLIVGGAVCSLGIGATVFSFMAVEHGGAKVVLYLGAVACGAFQFYCGLSRLNHW
jgi:hypothetical protein